MAYVRRHWLSSAFYTVIVVLGLAVWLTPVIMPSGAIEEARAQKPEPQPIDPHLYTRAQKLRQELSLTTLDLAAMGCTEESATQILTYLKSWCQTNQSILDQHRRDELNTKAALREAVRLMNVGSQDNHDADTLLGLRQELAKLYEKRQTVLDGLVSQLETHMNTSQRGTWQIARETAGLPARLRYTPDLTDQQRQAIHDELRDRTSQASIGDVLANELTWSQKQAADAVQMNIATKAQSVRSAEAAVLPVPEALKEGVVTRGVNQRF